MPRWFCIFGSWQKVSLYKSAAEGARTIRLVPDDVCASATSGTGYKSKARHSLTPANGERPLAPKISHSRVSFFLSISLSLFLYLPAWLNVPQNTALRYIIFRINFTSSLSFSLSCLSLQVFLSRGDVFSRNESPPRRMQTLSMSARRECKEKSSCYSFICRAKKYDNIVTE